MENKKIEIPDYVVLTQDMEAFKNKFATNGVNEAYKQLKSINDLAEVIPDEVKDIKPELVKSFIDDRIAEIEATKMLTIDARNREKNEWEEIRKKALSLIASIQNFFTSYPSAEFALVGESLLCTNTDAVTFEHCKRSVPKENVMKHYDLIQNVRTAIDALWAFEREHDWPSDNLLNVELDLMQIEQPEKLATNWVYREWQREYRKQHPYLDGAYNVARKSSLAEQNARLAELRKKHLEEHPEDFVELGNKQSPYESMGGGKLKNNADYDFDTVEMK